MTLHNPYDTLFKEVFSRPVQAAALLRHALPGHVSRRIRWDRLELQDSGVRGHHGELRVDLMYRAPAPPRRSPFFLLEHKSGPDASTPYQLFRYAAAIWHRHQVTRSRRVVALPAVFAVVVVHGRHRGRRGRTLADLVDWSWPEPERMQSLPIFVLDLTRMTSDELRNLPMPVLARVTLFCLAIARDRRDIVAELDAWTTELRALQADDDGVRGLESVLWYLVQVANVPYADLKKFFALEVGPIAKEVLMSTLSQYTKEVRKKTRAKALAEGHAKGHAEGLAEGQARILLEQLTVRFGPLPESVERRVRRAHAAERERWARRLLRARTLGEVLRRD
jgi:hypothetical protein